LRYLFRGLIRDSGRPVEGHVEAGTDDEAYAALGRNGVVTESLVPDPKPLDLSAELPASPEFADALESAFDSSSSQVDFDALTDRYRGKKVWVIDRDKIRRRVAQVVDAALALSAQHGEGAGKTRERVANAIQGLFEDNRNIASERNAETVAGVRFNGGAAPGAAAPGRVAPPAGAMAVGGNGAATAGHPGLENQIARLANLVRQAESAVAAVSAAARHGGGGGGGGGRRRTLAGGPKGEEQNAVLLEIFKSNLALVRGMQEGTLGGAAPAPEGGATAVATPTPASGVDQAPASENEEHAVGAAADNEHGAA